jgi:hypothetical protein
MTSASSSSRPVEGIPAETFAAAVTAAVSQILAAREISASGNTRFIIYTDDGIPIDPCQDTINCRIIDI